MPEMKWPSTTIWVQVEDQGEPSLVQMEVDQLFEELDDGEGWPVAAYRFDAEDELELWDYREAYAEHRRDRSDQIKHDAGLQRMQRP